MSRGTLLIAGALALDDIDDQDGIIGGSGGIAAIAAANLAPTQLWARGGDGYAPQVRGILANRRIDLAGVGWDGPTPTWSAARGFIPGGTLLPTIKPTTADGVGGVLVIGLPPRETARALAVVRDLPGDRRQLVVVPRLADLRADAGFAAACANDVDVLIVPAAYADGDPLALADRLHTAGAKCVLVANGPYGGLIRYQNKTATWPAMPVTVVEPTGITAAFAGTLAGWCAADGSSDFRSLKRGLAMASAVAGLCALGVGPRKLLAANSKEFTERSNKLRRAVKP